MQYFNDTHPNDGMQILQNGKLKFNFIIMLNNEDFDNDDNPYGNLIFHTYTNMQQIDDNGPVSSDAFNDVVVPLKICDQQ